MISMYILGFTWFEMDSLCTLCTNMLDGCVVYMVALPSALKKMEYASSKDCIHFEYILVNCLAILLIPH